MSRKPFTENDFRHVLGQFGSSHTGDDDWSDVCKEWRRYHDRTHRRELGRWASGDVPLDAFIKKREQALGANGRGKGGNHASSGDKLIKLAARVLYKRARRMGKPHMDANEVVLASLKPWRGQSAIYGYLEPEKGEH
jgi:hypothetical protein